MKVCEYISQYLQEREISHVFGVSGANIEDLYAAIVKKSYPSIVLAKNEYNAGTMAIGSYLSTKKLAVVMTTSGPGILNMLPVLTEAFVSKIPFIQISGMVPNHLEGMGAFQDTSGKGGSPDILEMIKECSCFHAKIINAKEMSSALDDAFYYAMKEKRPAVILIPKDILNNEFVPAFDLPLKNEGFAFFPDAISNAQLFCREFGQNQVRPLVILGEELIHLKSMDIVYSFIQKSGAKVAVTANAKGLFDHRAEEFLGVAGIMGHGLVSDYLSKADTLILIGVNFDLMNRFGLEDFAHNKKILIIKEKKDCGLYCFKSHEVCELYGDVLENITALGPFSPLKKIIHQENWTRNDSSDLEIYSFKSIINEIQTKIEDDSNVFVDAGNSGAFVIHHLKTRGNCACHVSLGMGGMGNSIGAGIGGALSSKKKSYVFLGDGAFLMYGMEIHTAIEYDVPIVFFIFNNNSHGMCSTRENIFLDGETGINNFKKSHFSKGLGYMFPGLITHDVNTMDDLRRSLVDVVARKSPQVITINISNSEDPPFKTFVRN